MNYVVIISAAAERDIQNAVMYISDVFHNKQAALRLNQNIRKKLETLSYSPLRNPLVRNRFLANKGIRMLIIGNYLALYKISEDHVNVLRVYNKRQNWIYSLYTHILNEDE